MIKIEVTQEDIDSATGGHCNCPIARAINRSGIYKTLCSGLDFILVEEIAFTKPTIYKTPVRATTFMRKFDNNRNSVTPTTFKLTQILHAK